MAGRGLDQAVLALSRELGRSHEAILRRTAGLYLTCPTEHLVWDRVCTPYITAISRGNTYCGIPYTWFMIAWSLDPESLAYSRSTPYVIARYFNKKQ